MIHALSLASLFVLAPLVVGQEHPAPQRSRQPSTQQSLSQWPQFLGSGMATTDTAPRSLAFDRERDLAWRSALPRGSSSPCIHGERIFLTGAEGNELFMLAFDRKTGAELWRRSRKTEPPVPSVHIDADPAAPSACTDGERVVFYFGTYGLVVLDLEGKLLWEKKLPFPEAAFGIGTSPILLDDLVILSRDGCPDAAVLAFDKKDGAERWSVPRLGFTFSFGTPFVWTNSGRRELIVAGTQRLTALDPEDGKPLWELGGLTSFVCTTPTADAETLYFAAWSTPDAAPDERNAASWGDMVLTPEELADAGKFFARLDVDADGKVAFDELPVSRARDAFAFLDGDGDGSVSLEELTPLVEMPKGTGDNVMVAVAAGGKGALAESHVRWRYRRGLPYVSSPLLYQGRLYLVSSGGMVTCLDPETGAAYFDRERLEDRSEYYASPVGADGHVIVCSSAGAIYVLRASDEFELVHSVELHEPIHATPALVDGMIYVRTEKSLLAFGK